MLPESTLYVFLLYGMLATAVCTFISLFFTSAAYGRHSRAGWGPSLPATLGWILMEAPSPLLFAMFWLVAEPSRRFSWPGIVFLLLWELHYVYRAFVFPFRRRGGQGEIPLSIVLMGILFNLLNAYMNARWLYTLGPLHDASWFADPRFFCGLALFALGFFINQQSDTILFNLRKPGETGYKLPYGGLYRYISCPNYLGELVEWSGYALLTFSPGALVFVLWTAANLIPRAYTHHRWYQEKFPDYPVERRAIFPFVF